MKKHLFTILAILALTLIACEPAEPAPAADETAVTEAPVFDEDEEKAAIMAVIEQETKCFFERDYECWKTHWIHEPYAYQAWNNDDGTFSAAVGWDAIDQQGKDYIDNLPEGQTSTSHPIVKREDLQFKFYHDQLAYLIWKQYNSDRANEFYSVSHETRLMEKVDGAWKIVNVTALWDMVNKVAFEDLE